jgi:putative FmdB family regulatory protein
MPFYEYQCKNCGHTLEAMQKVNDSPLKKCPSCGKSQLTRLMSAPVFRLKGGGWYETDFKGEQDHKKNLADRPEADASSTAEAKPGADAKTDAAKEAPTKDAPAKDAASKDAGKAGDKSVDKPAKAAPAESVKKPASAGISRRGTGGASVKAKSRKAPAKVAKKSKSRR